jgi:hypothetical protein
VVVVDACIADDVIVAFFRKNLIAVCCFIYIQGFTAHSTAISNGVYMCLGLTADALLDICYKSDN